MMEKKLQIEKEKYLQCEQRYIWFLGVDAKIQQMETAPKICCLFHRARRKLKSIVIKSWESQGFLRVVRLRESYLF